MHSCTILELCSIHQDCRQKFRHAVRFLSPCHQWVWDATIEFLSNKGYTHQPLTHTQRIHKSLKHIVKKNSWPANPSSLLPLLYLIGKAKSLVKCSILWRPIAAVVEPQIECFCLRMAARAFTLLLRTLISEIPGCGLVLRISDMNDWFHGLSEWECQVIAEAICLGQFNNIKPQDVMTSLSEASHLASERTTLVRSGHGMEHPPRQ